jgi:hypothetical protein
MANITIEELAFPYPRLTVVEFENLVREVYTRLRNHRWTMAEYPIEVALQTARILSVLEHQPELLTNSRLRYNLGIKKSQWLDDLWAAYAISKEE